MTSPGERTKRLQAEHERDMLVEGIARLTNILRRCHEPVADQLAASRNLRKLYEGYKSRERRYDTEIQDLERLLADITAALDGEPKP